jgi:putative DNA primase/helicase
MAARIAYPARVNKMQHAIEHFKSAIQHKGITPPSIIIGDGNRHRFHVEGDKRGSLNGWYRLHLDGRAAGSFGDWKQGIKERWKLEAGRQL